MLDLESLFKLSYGMCIISSKRGDRFNGCIVNTAFQVTPEPPMIAVSINKGCLTGEYITASRVFVISVLSEQTPKRFIGMFGFRSGRDIDKFEHVRYRRGQNGAPIVLDNSVAFIEAEVTESIDIETHTLFIARISACQTLDDEQPPMTYSYYRDIKHGRTPRTAATYIEKKRKIKAEDGVKIMKKYECIICGYIYDPAVGDPDNGIAAGVGFEDLPAEWVCPECGAGKEEFEPID